MAEAPQLFGSRVRWLVAVLQPTCFIKNEDLGQQFQKRLEDQGILLFQLLGLCQQMLKGCS
jgi:hypothetical protein